MNSKSLVAKLANMPVVLLCAVILGAVPIAPLAAQQKAAQQNRNVQLNRKPYFVVFFTKGQKWDNPAPKEETDRLLQGHLAFLRKQVESGKYALSGPLSDDGPIRGIIVLSAASADEAVTIVSVDPMVQSRQFGVEVHPGMFPDLSAVRAIYPGKSE